MAHKIVLIVIAAVVSALAGVAVFEGGRTDTLRVVFFDVGQGDAALITSPSGRTILIDTGKDGPLIARKLARHLPWHRPVIDILVLTHPDKDHIGGAEEVIAQYDIGGVLMPHVAKDSELFGNILMMLEERSIPVLFGLTGDHIALGEDTLFSLLWPPRHATEQAPILDANNMSLVGLLTYRDDSFLFTGDIEIRAETLMPYFVSIPHADVLKVGHHGSDTSTSAEFLQAVYPSVAVVSVGENRYGHPSAEVLERLVRISILRTDINGDITLISNGNNF